LKKSANAFFINAVTIEARTQKTIEQGSQTKEGYNMEKICKVCGKELSAANELDALVKETVKTLYLREREPEEICRDCKTDYLLATILGK